MAKTEIAQKLRLRIKSYDHKLIDNSARQIIEAAERNDAKIVGPIPLPTEVKHYTVNRSTFVHKDAREQFELRIHKRLVEILNPRERYLRLVVDRATENAAVANAIYIQYKASRLPVPAQGTGIIGETFTDPAEGTA